MYSYINNNISLFQVIAKGPGLEKTGVATSKWAEFTVDAKKAGKAPLKITCLDVDLKPVDVQITDNKDGTYACKYMPKRAVKHTVTITWGGVQVPKSPFKVCGFQILDLFNVCHSKEETER